MTRRDVLAMAMTAVTERQKTYGLPENNFGTIAGLWSVYLAQPVTAVDAAMMMALMKIARIRAGGTEDSFVDLAGYAACGGELFTEEDAAK